MKFRHHLRNSFLHIPSIRIDEDSEIEAPIPSFPFSFSLTLGNPSRATRRKA